MEGHKKIVFGCVLIFAVLVCAVFNQLLNALVAYFDLFVYGSAVEIAARLVPIGVGIGTFAGLYRYPKSYQYMTEVVTELKKVTWPGSKDVRAATIVVIIGVLIAGAMLGVFDTLWSYVIRKIIEY